MKKKLIHSLVLFTLLFVSNGVRSQVTYNQFLIEDDIHHKAELGLELWNDYLRSDIDSLKVAAVELLMDASEKEDEFARAVGTRMLGSYLYKTGKIDQGLGYMISSRDYFEKHEDYVTCSELYNEVGNALFLKAEYDEAIKSYEKSILYGKKSTDPTAEFNAEIGMGKAYIAKGDTSIGLNYIHNYKRLSIEQEKYEAAADALAYLGMFESDRYNANLSNEYYFRSLSYSKKSNSKIHLSHAYANMGILKFSASDYDSSLYYFEKSLELRIELNNTKGIVEGYNNIGYLHAETGKPELAMENYVKAKDLAKKNGFLSDEIEILEEMINVRISQKNHDQVEILNEELRVLNLVLKEQKGVDQDILKSIDLDFSTPKEEKESEEDGGIGWKELTIAILIVGLIIFFISERRRIS